VKQSRCMGCHFRAEEREAFRYLPAPLRAQLLAEHLEIERSYCAGVVPHELLEHHSRLENETFPIYLPEWLAHSLINDHNAYRLDTPTHFGCQAPALKIRD
jgi:hypothetical protein